MDEEKQLGKIKIEEEVLAQIAGIAATQVKGVCGISTSLVGGIAKFFKKKPDIGVKVILGEGEVSFELGIEVEYGVSIPEVTYEVQERIKKEVEKMSGLKVANVDVIVKEVKLPKKEQK
ncbi:MAG: Asp23/Gls24 family envelope stress response protein [Candidatus Omnitrophica bacterium]|nr:Asp23/Gls24 family envelope stress response protein [Candidatus Omnitrophota bacterium]MCM8808161.1 Asp23/Gls24 family envelope stress response protein [Candidatus Omnitrophota bacterium]